MVERPVRVRRVDAGVEQPRHQRLRGGAVALVDEGRVARLVPRVLRLLPASLGPRPVLDRLVGQHAEGRDDVFLEVLVLVVAPDQHDVRRELVEAPSRVTESCHERLAMALRGAQPLIRAVLLAHRLGPAFRSPVALGKVGILKDALEDARHMFVLSGERRVVRDSETEDRAHDRLPLVQPVTASPACRAAARPVTSPRGDGTIAPG